MNKKRSYVTFFTIIGALFAGMGLLQCVVLPAIYKGVRRPAFFSSTSATTARTNTVVTRNPHDDYMLMLSMLRVSMDWSEFMRYAQANPQHGGMWLARSSKPCAS